jgi:predicted peptidase
MRPRDAVGLLAMFFAASCAPMQPRPTGFLDRIVTMDGTEYPYVVYVPDAWRPDREWPVILFLHGAGERGSDGRRAAEVGLGKAVRATPDRFAAIIVFPQAPEDERWIGPPAEAAMEALKRSMTEFNGDASRIYLTGLSMGGYGVWHLALAHPYTFAALVPVCGGIVPNGTATSVRRSPLTGDAADPYTFTAERLRHLPVWMFHGADDGVVRAEESRRMHAALLAAGASSRLTDYAGVGHNAWDPAYGENELWEWLVSQRRRQ